MEKENKILVIRFFDNDFITTFEKFGEFLLKEVGFNTVKHMYTNNQFEVFTILFRASLILHQHRYDMYNKYNTKENFLKDCLSYLNNEYFNLKNIQFKSTFEDEYDNSETLIVDFYNNKVHIV